MKSAYSRLCIMMFLQYFAWGVWFVTLSYFILFNTGEKGSGAMFGAGFIGYAFATSAIAGMISPFFVGMVADRFFPTQWVLAALHLAGAALLFGLSMISSQTMFYWMMLAFFLCYMPTLALTNSISFHNLAEPAKQFPGVRVLGTIGWIVAGILTGGLLIGGASFEAITGSQGALTKAHAAVKAGDEKAVTVADAEAWLAKDLTGADEQTRANLRKNIDALKEQAADDAPIQTASLAELIADPAGLWAAAGHPDRLSSLSLANITGFRLFDLRLFGTGTGVENTRLPMHIGAFSMLLLGLFCVALPHTPPGKQGEKITIGDVLGLEALGLMKRWPFLVFVIGSFLITIPLQFYYGYTNGFLNDQGMPAAAAQMTLGQMSEIIFMLLMPFFFIRLGVKYMLLIGMLCWAVRYVCFAFGFEYGAASYWMIYVGILLHGICYDFFFVTGQIYVDNEAGAKNRGAAQGFIAFVTLGLGGFIGSNLAGVVDQFLAPGTTGNWTMFWLIPAGLAGVVMVLFALTFFDTVDDRKAAIAGEEVPQDPPAPVADNV